jgi:hypothetical protein
VITILAFEVGVLVWFVEEERYKCFPLLSADPRAAASEIISAANSGVLIITEAKV